RLPNELPRRSGSMEAGLLFGAAPIPVLLNALTLCNDARRDAEGNLIGDPTETALLSLAIEKGVDQETIVREHPRLAEIPFDSERKRMTTVHAWPSGGVVSITKGAVEEIIGQCVAVYRSDGRTECEGDEVMAISDAIAGEGLRTLGVAMRIWDAVPETMTPDRVESDLIFIGMVGMMDPPRAEVIDAVDMCWTAGIRPVMITGDHPLTAEVIARRVGILREAGGRVMTGRELDAMPQDAFESAVESVQVYARVAPEQKLTIVKALQDRGQFVAMTGDGVNDAPALKRADIGVAMGITGTDVSKEAAAMILLDDNFATIVRTVREGRCIFDNIRKFIQYTMTSNAGEICTIFFAPFFGLPIPLLPIHILWINLVTDGIPGLALAAEPAERDVMRRPPRHPKESIFAHGLGWHIVWVGLLMGAVTIATQALFLESHPAQWQTMVFTVLCLSQMGNVLAIRSETESLFHRGLFSNKPMLGAVLLTVMAQMATIYVPFLNMVFRTKPLSVGELGMTFLISSVVFAAVETNKAWRRRRAILD
ncbi:cation-transporting P-type ATPase, partial [bacterium]|nr:cation-transporting P-type ATPase [candidate division CSSED10-310 bacterium]